MWSDSDSKGQMYMEKFPTVFADTNQERIVVKTTRQSIYIMCEMFDIWQRDLDDKNRTWTKVK